MGWLVRYSEERNYCLYSYLAHLDRVAKDPAYKFAFSEIPHLITMMDYEPRRFEEFRQRVKEGRIECVNAFVLEPTVNLSGGEALVQQGVQGMRWYRQTLDLQPRYCWMIDTVGWHEQMAQVVTGLGLEAFVYCRYNPTAGQPGAGPGQAILEKGSPIHWIESPDGTRALALCPGSYAAREFGALFKSQAALPREELGKIIDQANGIRKRAPTGAPVLVLGGGADYSLPFRYEGYPAQLLAAWNTASPNLQLRLATPSVYLNAILPGIHSGQYKIRTVTSGSSIYGWSSFWMNVPIVKQWYRRAEHSLQAAEALAAIASLTGPMNYPSQELANAWLLMALNMDRALLWGVAVDGAFGDDESWDTRDRFEYVEARVAEANEAAFGSLTQRNAGAATLFNPVNWTRKEPVELSLPRGRSLAGADCQLLEDGRTVLARVPLPPLGLAAAELEWANLAPPARTDLPGAIETPYYSARIDPGTGALVSLKLKPSGREMLGGAANVILAERKGDPHSVPQKGKRKPLATSSQFEPHITVTTGKLATIVEIRSPFHAGGELRRVIRFYQDSPRIDFVTETNGLPARTILSVEFPLAEDIVELRRGIPYGFSRGDCVRQIPGVTGLVKGIMPVIRWSDYTFKNGGGLAVLDRGVPARELVGRNAILLLHNVCDFYYKRPVTWMADPGKQVYSYAIFAHAQEWDEADVPRMGWEYNCPVVTAAGCSVPEPRSFVETSGNVVVQALRRQGDEIELRLVECFGKEGKAWVKIDLPHVDAALTDLLGRNRRPLPPGSQYTFVVRPQQIVTMRLKTGLTAAPVQAPRSFDSMIPPTKQDFMGRARNPKLLGHPPRTTQPVSKPG